MGGDIMCGCDVVPAVIIEKKTLRDSSPLHFKAQRKKISSENWLLGVSGQKLRLLLALKLNFIAYKTHSTEGACLWPDPQCNTISLNWETNHFAISQSKI